MGLHRQGPAGRREAAWPAVRQAAPALEVRPEQGSILRGGSKNFGPAVSAVNYFFKIRLILARRLVAQAAMQPLVIVIAFEVLKELPARLSFGRKDWLAGKRFGL